jgi:phosphoheptose isomerase
MQLESNLRNHFEESANVKMEFIKLNEQNLQNVIKVIDDAIKSGHKILICGNG